MSTRRAGRALRVAGALALCAGAAIAQTFNGSAVNTAGNSLIPSTGTGGCAAAPQTTGGTIFNNTVAGVVAGTPILSVQINLTHTFDSDLDIYLRAPNGQVLELTSDNGAGNDNYTNTLFVDGALSITAGAAPFTGTFAPEGTLTVGCSATFQGTITSLAGFTAGQNGTWQLFIADDVGADTGTMLSWSITFGTCLVTCPANITVSNTPDFCTAVVNYPAPTTGGTCGTITCTPPSGSTYQLGTTTVTCTASAGPSCAFSITVDDTQAPALTCPADIVSAAPPGGLSTPVDYPPPTVSDNCPGVQAPGCAPPSGDAFPVGVTTVVCSAADAAGNDGTCAFDVTVGNQAIQEIPTASSLGLAALALLLAGAAFVALRRAG